MLRREEVERVRREEEERLQREEDARFGSAEDEWHRRKQEEADHRAEEDDRMRKEMEQRETAMPKNYQGWFSGWVMHTFIQDVLDQANDYDSLQVLLFPRKCIPYQ
jgi:hypothetical protein